MLTAVVVVAGAIGLSGCAGPLVPAETPTEAPTETPTETPAETALPGAVVSAPGPAAVDRARRRLTTLAEVDRQPTGLAPYERDAFGDDWADTDGNGCNQRDDVLLRDAVAGTVRIAPQGACDHDVLAGTWIDPYTGADMVFTDLKDLGQAQAIQIDHVVPLAEAWISGASTWDDQRRRTFASDLAGLLAADGPTNAAKGSDDPAAWRPRLEFQCAYAVRWIDVKHRWALAADASERSALQELLATCN